MIPVDEALARTLALAPAPIPEEVLLAEANGRVLLAPVAARLTQPPFDAASMDGYALRSADLPGPLTVVGEAAAGREWDGEIAPGQAVRIFTGAPVPDGCDRVVMQENVTREGERIAVTDASGGSNIRPRGNDFSEGSVIDAGRRLGPAELALIAAMNVPRVTVARRPVVAILPGGDELVPPGTNPGAGQIINSNDIAIAAIAAAAGALPRILPITRDTAESLRAGLEAAADADIIVTIGGASVGDHDLIAPVTEAMGMERAFWKLAMRPGKPLVVGRLGNALMLGLPGNPISAMVSALLFLRPLIERMQGLPGTQRLHHATLGCDLPPEGPRQHYLRARLNEGAAGDRGLPVITPDDNQDSASLSVMAAAGALLVRPAHDPARRAGEVMDYLSLRDWT
ncbi:molybdopterin molybdenumtransferase MoeA [Paracoccus suum]|uniref:Molybdopterin molybdenumtransferase n=1 Tax=Paracoccus suum TaxID=2259340 RepID=A0A344PKD7_9RHOB|nr:gephyrin-like molybdotransferase Glp [Paracoccus suum]AXC49842.1 molybdopterin molybdenumtransferase MoeA [Paracoccus suum]